MPENDFCWCCDYGYEDESCTCFGKLERSARMFYKLGGWEKYWPWEKMPEWLFNRYATPELIKELKPNSKRII